MDMGFTKFSVASTNEEVLGAANALIDRAFIIIDMPRQGEFIVQMKPKKDGDSLANFLDVLDAYSRNLKRYKRQMLSKEDILNKDDDALDDPEGIAVPWEEKYGKRD